MGYIFKKLSSLHTSAVDTQAASCYLTGAIDDPTVGSWRRLLAALLTEMRTSNPYSYYCH